MTLRKFRKILMGFGLDRNLAQYETESLRMVKKAMFRYYGGTIGDDTCRALAKNISSFYVQNGIHRLCDVKNRGTVNENRR